MIRDIPHWKTIVSFGLAGLIASVVMLTWVYPAYCDRYQQVKEEKTREYIENNWGIPAPAPPLIEMGADSRPLPPKVLRDGSKAAADPQTPDDLTSVPPSQSDDPDAPS